MINDAGESNWTAFDGLHYYLISQTFCASAAPRVRVRAGGRAGWRERESVGACSLGLPRALSLANLVSWIRHIHHALGAQPHPQQVSLFAALFVMLPLRAAARASYLISAANLISLPLAPRGRRERERERWKFSWISEPPVRRGKLSSAAHFPCVIYCFIAR